MTITKISRRSFLFLGGATLAQGLFLTAPSHAQSVQINRGQFNGITFFKLLLIFETQKT